MWVSIAACVLFTCLATLAQVQVFSNLATILKQILEASSLAGEWVLPTERALAAFAIFCLCTFLAQWFASRTSSELNSEVAQLIFEKLVALGAPYTSRAEPNKIATLFGEGTQALSLYASRYVPQFFCAVVLPLGLAFVLAPTSIPVALVMLVFVYCMPIAIMHFMRRSKQRAGEQWTSYTNLGSLFHDAISGLSTLKVYGADAEEQHMLNNRAEQFRATTMRLLHVQLNSITFMDLFTYGGIALACAVALIQLYFDMLSSQQVFFIILVAPLVFAPMRTFGSLFHAGVNGEEAARALFDFLDEKEIPGGTQACAESLPSIVLENLSFAYDGEQNVLNNLNLAIAPNSIVGITGASGTGKSTLARVLCGVGLPYSGSAKIGGIEVRDLSPEALSHLVSIVSKESHLFKGTVRSNMLLADDQVADAYIWDCLRRARIADEVLAAGGLDAPVEEGGINFSGGQRQRLCFARAILRDTPIYIFDEAASNVDAESEKLLYDIMHEIAFTKTVIVISHRLRMLNWVDEIFVMQDGSVVQRGIHSELLGQEGSYANLWQQYEQLEEFAASLAEPEQVQDVPLTPAQEVLASLPGMAATAMQAVMDAKQLQAYVNASSSIPSGHPAWIPLPASYKDINVNEGIPGNAELENEQNSEDVAELVEDTQQNRKEKPRSMFAVAHELAKITVPMRSDLYEALFAGFASSLSVIALVGFAACGVLAVFGLMPAWGLLVGIVGMFVCALARGPLHYGERLYTHDQTFKTLALVRARVFEAMRALAPAKLENRGAGDLIALVTSDVELLEGFYSRTFTPAASVLLCSAAFCIVACFFAPLIGLVLCCFVLLGGVLIPLILEHVLRGHGAKLRSFTVAMNAFLFDTLEGFADLVQLARTQEYASEMRQHFGTRKAGERSTGAQIAALTTFAIASILLLQIVFVVLAWYIVSVRLAGVAAALMVVLVGIALLSALADIAQLGTKLHQTHAAASRILDIIEEAPITPEVKDGISLEAFTDARAHDVSFGYTAQPVLENLSVDIPQGQFVRVIGESGTGKTTLLRLFMRFWDAQSGSIRLSDTDIRDINTKSLRRNEAFMAQDTYLFARSLRENLLLANRRATEEELSTAIDAAALTEVIERLPHGLDTSVGKGGVQLSEGERQRVGLARAFLHDAPFMILDEPTSNLDALNEAAILYSLAANTKGKTVLVASHRPTMGALADQTITLTK